jgi:demethylmenaquinone methyltransferase/2-methoxy-6-polyprenyl-1,4-benzoquinol methylase
MVAILDAHPDCEEIWGADPAERMLERAKEKLSLSPHQHKVHFVAARADELPFENEYFDAISISFGIRNVPDVHATLVAMKKILKREGKLLILECSKPERLFFARLQKYFLRYGISALGRLITGDYSAYLYLADTVATFPSGENFCKLMRQAGFIECTMTPFCFGMTTLYVGI